MTRIAFESTGRRIQPFDDPIGDVPIQNRPLSAWQADMVRDGGFERVERPEPPCLVVPDTLFATGDGLRRFVAAAAGRDAVLVVGPSLFARSTAFVQPGVEQLPDGGARFHEVRYVVKGDPPVDAVVDPMETVVALPVPAQYTGGAKAELSLPRDPFLTLHHWVHLLWANQAAGAIPLRRTPTWRGALTLLWAALRAFSVNRWRVLRQLSRVGRGCDIHPTALIEGATLGDGVTVGPYARVLFSTVGDGATIMAGAQVEASTLGERAVVCQGTVVRGCLLYPEAIAGQQVMQMCVLGKGVVTTLASYAIDLDFERPIRVPLDGALHSTGTQFLGSAFGHRSRIGTGLWMSHGRMIPNDAVVIRHPDDVLRAIPEHLGAGPHVNEGGRLVPWVKR